MTHARAVRSAKKKAFLSAYKECATVTHAALAAKISRRNHYRWLETDQNYRLAFEEARTEACEAMISEARRRAVEGVEEPVYYQGKVVGTVQTYSDNLLMFLIKGAMPEKYRERYEITGGSKPVQFLGYDASKLAKLTEEQLETLRDSLKPLVADTSGGS